MMLYIVTNRLLSDNEDYFLKNLSSAANSGANAIIIREKDLTLKNYYKLALKIKKTISNTKCKLIVHTHFELAKKLNTRYVHLTFNDFIKSDYSSDFIKGVSVHSSLEAEIAFKKGASYLIVGHIFKTECKKNLEPKGLEFLNNIKKIVGIPVIAIGGIKPHNCNEIIKINVDGIAVMSEFMKTKNAQLLTKQYINKFHPNFKI